MTSESLASLIENALGGSGNDVFVGNQVNNTFNGGLGADSYTGGDGADVFVFDGNDGGIDHVLDFNPAQGDKIDAHGLTYSVTLTADGWTEVIFGTDYAVILDGFNSQDPNSGWLIA